MFALVDYAQIYYYENSLQNGMREAARFATAGRIIQKLNPDGSPVYVTNGSGVVVPVGITANGHEVSRNESIRFWFQSNSVIQLPPANITIVSAPTLPGQPPYVSTNSAGKLRLLLDTNGGTPNRGPGFANDYVQIVVTNTIPTITPLFGYLGGFSHGSINTYTVRVSAIVKNEPALLNFQHTNIYAGEPFDPNWTP